MSDVSIRPLRGLVDDHRSEIRRIVAEHQGRSVFLFGSVARGDETPNSDVDLLVEFEPEARPFEILAVGAELEHLLGVKVDVGSIPRLRARLRSQAQAEAIEL
ncbi:MAG: nucleotidyltransferase [Acidimicrobiia bacterium]|nr:nucleotidyltransferase [Acidimicrobiia bacterium]